MSVLVQTIPPRHIVSTDDPEDTYPEGDVVIRVERQAGRGHNLYFNQMRHHVPPDFPWIIFLDDDDTFTRTDSLETIAAAIRSENNILLWRVNTCGRVIPETMPPAQIVKGQVTGIGFCVHVKNWIDWPGTHSGDFEVIRRYCDTLEPVWIDDILTAMQRGAGQGRRIDF